VYVCVQVCVYVCVCMRVCVFIYSQREGVNACDLGCLDEKHGSGDSVKISSLHYHE